jgi:hypothetical protein
MQRAGWAWVAAISTCGVAGPARAAPCDCQHVLELDVGVADGDTLGVGPGDEVCVRGGPREYLRLQHFHGAEGQPIVIRNCEGVVDLDNADRGYALTVDGSSFVRVTGTGEGGVDYGFRARASRTGPDYAGMSVAVGDLSTDIELDHVEAHGAGFAGIMWKTDPRCDGSANLGAFVMRNSSIHHNWVHDTGGEGLYFGSTGYGGREYTCDGEQVILYPHEHHGADIHHNVFERTGWDGAQIGVTPQGCAFYRNTIREVGLAGELYQQQGLQIGGASACAVWGNVLMDGPTNGIFVLGAGDTLVYNNLVVDFGDAGIYANDQDLPLAARFRFAFNTVIVGAGQRGIAVFGAQLGPGWAYSNAVAGPQPLGVGNEVPDFELVANQTADAPDALGFVDPAARDFHLRPDAPLRDAGQLPPDLDVADDLEGVPRSDGAPDVGALEWSPDPPPDDDTTTGEPTTDGPDDPTTTGDPTTSPTTGADATSAGDVTTAPGGSDGPGDSGDAGPTGDTAGGADDGGCGCRGAAPSPWLALLLLAPRRRRAPSHAPPIAVVCGPRRALARP